jgi:hypothetical protein
LVSRTNAVKVEKRYHVEPMPKNPMNIVKMRPPGLWLRSGISAYPMVATVMNVM